MNMSKIKVNILLDNFYISSDNKLETLTWEKKEESLSNFTFSDDSIKLLKDLGVIFLFPIQVKAFIPYVKNKI